MAKKTVTLPKLKKKAQEVFNKYIRLRDSEDGYFKCISCSEVKPTTQMNAGHYFAVKGYDGLRFDEVNCNGEDAGCNCFNESHLIGYTINLKKKIGDYEYNELLERAAHYKRYGYKWSRHELQEIIYHYKAKIKTYE